MIRLRSSIRHPNRLRGEVGIVLPATLSLMLVIAIIATVAARTGIVASHQTFRDASTKRAIAAATAGMKAAIYETNMVQPTADQCVSKNASTGALSTIAVSNGWCPQALTENLDDNASYSATVSSSTEVTQGGTVVAQRRVVSTGTVNGVKRRVAAWFASGTGVPLFASDTAIRSDSPISFQNNVTINGGIGSNNNINLQNNVTVCGNATPGPGKSVTLQNNAHLCNGYVTTPASTNFTLPQVDQGNSTTVNDNGRIGVEDTWTSKGSSSYTASTRNLNIQNNATLTLTGSVYNFCKINIQNNAQLRIALRSSGAVRIYMDTPEHCGGAGWGGINIQNNGALVNLNSSVTTLQIYITGSPTIATTFNLQNNAGSDLRLVINAPNSTVNLQNNAHIRGAIQAKSVTMQNNSQVDWDSDAGTLTTSSVVRVYHRQEWVECTPEPTGSAPDSGC